MRLLILGGTGFVGRHLAQIAIADGHEVTLFNRGRSGRDLFPQARTLVGDRESDLSALRGGKWDLAFDIASYFPRVTRLACETLKNSVAHYTLVSTMALYSDFSIAGLKETDPVSRLEDPNTEDVNHRTYGGLKALCEDVVSEFFSGRSLILRPGIIIGPYDNTDRFTYWVDRISRSGRVLTPDSWDQPFQYIDVRDLMKFALRAAETGLSGVFNCTGPVTSVPLGMVFETCARTLRSGVSFAKVPKEFLLKRLSKPGEQLPFWMPRAERLGFMQIDSSRAQGAGLNYRSLAESVIPTLEWSMSLPQDHNWRAGLSKDEEESLFRDFDAIEGASRS